MKFSLTLATLLGAYAFLASSQQNLKNDIPTLNEARRNAAKEKGIANMWKLEWDDQLAGKARSACGKDLMEGVGRVIHLSDNAEDNLKIVNALNQAPPGQLPAHHGPAELGTHATQTRIGCDRFECQYPFPNGQFKTFETVCIMGPQTTYQLTDFKKGTPGSACGGARVEDGLCSGAGRIGLFFILIFGFKWFF